MPHPIYCLRCQRDTPTKDVHRAGTATHPCVKGKCSVCDAGKCEFVKSGSGLKRKVKRRRVAKK